MPTVIEVSDWIAANVLDTDAWDRSAKQGIAVVQAERNLARWYPTVELIVPLVAYQAIWELQGVDPALRYQKHNVKQVTDGGEQVSFKDGERSLVAPDVRELLGNTAEEIAEQEAANPSNAQYGGALI
jgi:hypothetical protein